MTVGWLRFSFLFIPICPAHTPVPLPRLWTSSKSARPTLWLYKRRLSARGGGRGAGCARPWGAGASGVLDLWARPILGHHQVVF